MLHRISQFYKYVGNIPVSLYLVKDPVQSIETDCCGKFQLFLQENLFRLNEESQILKHGNLTKHTVQKLVNELFSSISKYK